MVRRGLSPDEWDALSLRDQLAVSWWQFVQAAPTPMSDHEITQLPVKGGTRAKAMASQSKLRAALLPPDQED